MKFNETSNDDGDFSIGDALAPEARAGVFRREIACRGERRRLSIAISGI
jgi:hypothetical protein